MPKKPNIFAKPAFTHPSQSVLVQAKFQHALALHESGNLQGANALYVEILGTDPKHFESLRMLGILACQVGNWAAGVELIRNALGVKPSHAAAHSDLAVALLEAGEAEASLSSSDRAIALDSGIAEAHFNRGNALLALQQFVESVSSYDRAIAIRPDYAKAYCNRGNSLLHLRQLDEAARSFRRCIELRPDLVEGQIGLGNALNELRNFEDALACLDRAIALNPDSADAHHNHAGVMKELSHFEAALSSYARALEIKPDYEFVAGTIGYLKRRLCIWDQLAEDEASLQASIERGEPVAQPFTVLLSHDVPRLQQLTARKWSGVKHPADSSLGDIKRDKPNARIRIGYFSSDFRNHPVALLTAELFELHDRSQFEVVGFFLSTAADDAMSRRLRAAFDRNMDVGAMDDKSIAMLARDIGIDIAVDLGGLTAGARPGIFAYRAAPIQMSYVGYLGTMGVGYMDYLVADHFIVPDECTGYYDESLIYLPSYQVNDSKQEMVHARFSRAELGLPESGIVLCSFNNSFKFSPAVFATWLRIVKAVDGSVLWLLEDNPTASRNLRAEAQRQGVDQERLIFAPRKPRAEHLARYRVADLFLDTLPCNAGATASDALWAGLPVLTCAGRSFAARIAGSLLTAVGLPELITHSLQDYESLAIELALQPHRLAEIRDALVRLAPGSPLFDTAKFTQNLELAYQQAHRRALAGMPPMTIDVSHMPLKSE